MNLWTQKVREIGFIKLQINDEKQQLHIRLISCRADRCEYYNYIYLQYVYSDLIFRCSGQQLRFIITAGTVTAIVSKFKIRVLYLKSYATNIYEVGRVSSFYILRLNTIGVLSPENRKETYMCGKISSKVRLNSSTRIS